MGGNTGAARRHTARSIAVTAVLVLLVSLLSATAAFAAVGFEVDIDVDDTIVDTPGTIHLVDDEDDIPAEALGQQCTVRSVGLNQDSVHPDNDLIVESAGTTVILPDVERTPGQITEGIGTLTLGNIIVVSVRLGSDGVFSADHRLEVRCLGDPVTGRIIVVKEVTDGSDTSQAFQFTASYDADGSPCRTDSRTTRVTSTPAPTRSPRPCRPDGRSSPPRVAMVRHQVRSLSPQARRSLARSPTSSRRSTLRSS